MCAAGDFDQIRNFTLTPSLARLLPLVPARGSVAGQLHDQSGNHDDPCNASLQVNHRQVVVQPVGFSDPATDPSPSGSTAATRTARQYPAGAGPVG